MLDVLREATRRRVGFKQTMKAIESGEASTVFVAADADAAMVEQVRRAAERRGVALVDVESMRTLGAACKIDVGASAAAVLR